jgi:hypothetical protein
MVRNYVRKKICMLISFLTGSRLRVLENRVLKEIFGPKRSEAKREWGRIHNE